ncbi:hypothetical protein VN97_g4514 [Penicillium thymicola]|uniref:Uncharacterized protein n=1 Tax=Penicillium thymicola TaxID=293382 RepID=A0AAI9X9J6_PENTH|nr:hypothetical protein VN97_g4514 [Penicillium thymicola]
MNRHRPVVEVLERANVEASDNKIGWTPLHCAANHAVLEVVKILIHRGAAVNAQDDRVNWTSLHLVAI